MLNNTALLMMFINEGGGAKNKANCLYGYYNMVY